MDRRTLEGPAVEVAPLLLGCMLEVDGCSGRIVEVEAYEQFDDEASHSFRGETVRNQSMFGPAGTLYIYRIYGMHWCANVVCGPAGHGAAVLIRAIEPCHGIERMAARRGRSINELTELGSGPGKLCQAMGLTGEHDCVDLLDAASPVRLLVPSPAPATPPGTKTGGGVERGAMARGTRIGISKSVELPWRFGVAGSPHLSRRFG